MPTIVRSLAPKREDTADQGKKIGRWCWHVPFLFHMQAPNRPDVLTSHAAQRVDAHDLLTDASTPRARRGRADIPVCELAGRQTGERTRAYV